MMKDYKKLIEALRCNGECHDECAYRSEEGWCDAEAKMDADAADAIEELLQIADHYEQTAKDYWKQACDYKEQLPKHGEWKHIFGGYVECSICGASPLLDGEREYVETNYCPNCGAKMGVQYNEQS